LTGPRARRERNDPEEEIGEAHGVLARRDSKGRLDERNKSPAAGWGASRQSNRAAERDTIAASVSNDRITVLSAKPAARGEDYKRPGYIACAVLHK